MERSRDKVLLVERFSRAFAAAWEVERYAQEFDPKKHPKDAKGLWARKPTHGDIASLAQETVRTKRPSFGQSRRWHVYREIDGREAQAIRRATGIDVRGYAHTIDDSAIRHILRFHGARGSGLDASQIPVSLDDFNLLPEVTANPDAIEYGGKTRLGREAIRYTKRINGMIVYVEEVRTGQGKELAAVTMKKIRV